MTIKPSPQQEAVISATLTTKDNLAVSSGAGTAKTTTLAMCAHAYFGQRTALSRGCALAFAKRNALDFKSRLPSNVDSSTVNSLGHRGWGRKIQPKITFDEKKVWRIASDIGIEYGSLPDWGRLMSLARANCILPEHSVGQPQGSRLTDEWVSDLDLDYGEHSIEAVTDYLNSGLVQCIEESWRGVIDYDDQIYMPALYGIPKVPYDLLFGDEVQDWTPAQAQMIERLGAARALFFGDPNQSIYAFRGAMPSAFEEVSERFNATSLRLNVSFRCPKAVVAEAQRYVPDFYAADNNPDGIVTKEHLDVRAIPKPATILCRNNAPLTRVAYQFLQEGIGVNFVGGQDMAKSLLILLRKLIAMDAKTINHALELWEGQESSKLLSRGKSPEGIHDRADTMRAVIDRVGLDPSKINLEISRMFTRGGVITLSTIHRAKGMEWPDVYLLEFGLIGLRARTPVAKIQERNLAYVAITRAQRKLCYLE